MKYWILAAVAAIGMMLGFVSRGKVDNWFEGLFDKDFGDLPPSSVDGLENHIIEKANKLKEDLPKMSGAEKAKKVNTILRQSKEYA
jgi:hypothetical protein